MEEALAMIYDDDDQQEVSQIYMEPPESNVPTDEEGGILDNLSGRQLRAGAEVVFRSQVEPLEESEEPPEEVTHVTKQQITLRKNKKRLPLRQNG
ncbi:hypothetical protein JTB14_012808 [Gonioctena quinquepunctata]|nr:hypothetical protein JTB14_012808 [Gonioctena quinquepunctata]